MKDNPFFTRSFDLRCFPLWRQLPLMILAYCPPFPNSLRGFAGWKETLQISLTQAVPLWVYAWVMKHEGKLIRVFFSYLRKKKLF